MLSRNDLLNQVWGAACSGTTRALDQHIAQLRKKIETNPQEPRTLVTVHGVGCRCAAADGPLRRRALGIVHSARHGRLPAIGG